MGHKHNRHPCRGALDVEVALHAVSQKELAIRPVGMPRVYKTCTHFACARCNGIHPMVRIGTNCPQETTNPVVPHREPDVPESLWPSYFPESCKSHQPIRFVWKYMAMASQSLCTPMHDIEHHQRETDWSCHHTYKLQIGSPGCGSPPGT